MPKQGKKQKRNQRISQLKSIGAAITTAVVAEIAQTAISKSTKAVSHAASHTEHNSATEHDPVAPPTDQAPPHSPHSPHSQHNGSKAAKPEPRGKRTSKLVQQVLEEIRPELIGLVTSIAGRYAGQYLASNHLASNQPTELAIDEQPPRYTDDDRQAWGKTTVNKPDSDEPDFPQSPQQAITDTIQGAVQSLQKTPDQIVRSLKNGILHPQSDAETEQLAEPSEQIDLPATDQPTKRRKQADDKKASKKQKAGKKALAKKVEEKAKKKKSGKKSKKAKKARQKLAA